MAVRAHLPTFVSSHEQARLAALSDLHVLDGGPEASFDRLAAITADSLRFPIAYVSFIDADRQVLKTHAGALPCESPRSAAFCSTTIESGKPLVITDARADPAFADFPQVKGPPFVRAYWGVPLSTRGGFNVGALCLIDKVPREASDRELMRFSQFARLTMEFIELRAQATTDPLTGVATRRAFFSEGDRLFSTRDAERSRMACLAIDLDHFKQINDRFGHAAGDDVLRQVGAVLSSCLRPDSIVGRIGGEEFAVILPGEDIGGALGVAERLRALFADCVLPGLPRFTASIGVASRRAADLELKAMIARADAAAYEAKRAGRNRVESAMESR